jgi:hypothetical protein
MQVGATDGRNFHFHQYIVAAEGRNLYFPDLGAWGGLRLYDGKHGGRHESYLMNS